MIHCFSGNYELAMAFVEMGFCISFPGTVTYKNAADTQSAASRIPLERLLVEHGLPLPDPDALQRETKRTSLRQAHGGKDCSIETNGIRTTGGSNHGKHDTAFQPPRQQMTRPISKDSPLVLASGSPRRKQLLRQIGIPFRTLTSRVREDPLSRDPLDECPASGRSQSSCGD